MLATLVHRGPDDEGVISGAGATLGARRLAVIDVRGGRQPVSSEDGHIVAVQNGEIYNFEDLRKDLARRGHRYASFSDTEVLPHAYEEFGFDLVGRLHGMFALAVWDEAQRTLLLARDRFGKKPLFYFQGDGILAFASEIQALLAHPAIGRDVDADAVWCYFTLGYVPAPLSAFRHIRKVEPAHALSFVRGAIRRNERYWRLNFQPKLQLSKEEAVRELDDRISRAVGLRLRSDVPLGAFLSGGLDSSVVVHYMCRLSSSPVQTFSVGFGDADFDELPYARLVAQHLRTDHHEFVVGPDDVRALPNLIRNVGEPFADSSIVPTYQVARIAKSHVTVVLNGDGGDEVFGGYGHYQTGLVADALSQSILAGWPAASGAALLGRLSSITKEPRAIRRARRLLEALPMNPIDRYRHWTGPFTRRSRQMLSTDAIRGGLAADLDHYEREAYLSGARTGPERYMALDMLLNLPGDLLVKMDIATMANGLEARSPLLDHELAEFVAALPVDEKVSLNGSKRLLRRLAKSFLPTQIIERPKMGFSAPVAQWLRGPLREMFQDLVLAAASESDQYLPVSVSERLFEEHLRGSDHSRLLWSLLVYEIWYQECVRATPRSNGLDIVTGLSRVIAPPA
jgi:asparagine synthase (glutamine-hydrolysing)